MYPCLCGHDFPSYDTRLLHQASCETYQRPVVRRRYCVEIQVGADEYRDLIPLLDKFVLRLDEQVAAPPERTCCLSVVGGAVHGGSVDLHVDPTMTHERYFEFLTRRRSLEREPAEKETGGSHEGSGGGAARQR